MVLIMVMVRSRVMMPFGHIFGMAVRCNAMQKKYSKY